MISVRVDDKVVQEVLALVSSHIGTPRDLLAEGALNIRSLVRTVFDDETDPWGFKWVPHSDLTKKLRRRAGNASIKKLFVTGDLYRSLKSEATENGIEVTVGTEGSFAEVHQFGLDPSFVFGRPVGQIPRRSMLPMTRDGIDLPQNWWDAVLEPVAKRILELIK